MNSLDLLPVLKLDASEEQQDGKSQNELAEVLASSLFKKSPTLCKLLIYLWERRGEEVGEYAIATEGLGRKEDFEPRVNATVRVLVSRLRLRLKEFYDTEGAGLPRRIVIPIGSHQIQVVEVSTEPIEELPDPELLPRLLERNGRNRKYLYVQSAAIGLLILVCIALVLERNRAVSDAKEGRVRNLPAFWRDFLENGKGTRIIIPTPVFFGWGTGILARDVNVNDFSRLEASPALQMLEHQFGKATLAQQYVASSDALALLRLDQYLDPRGLNLTISTTAESPVDVLDRENLIVAGTPRTLAPFQSVLNRLSYEVDAEKGQVIERHPASGLPRKFDTVQQSLMHMTTPGVIACLPDAQGRKIIVFVTTYYTSALVSYLTSESGLAELRAAQKAHGDSPYFEAVIISEFNGTMNLKSHLVEFRSVPISSVPIKR